MVFNLRLYPTCGGVQAMTIEFTMEDLKVSYIYSI